MEHAEAYRPPTGVECRPLSSRPIVRPLVVYPGSFNPVHGGHLGLARIAAELIGRPVDFELSTTNVEKPRIDADDLHSRCEGLRMATAGAGCYGHLWLTAAPTFPEKAALFAGATFVVGLDTFRRIADPRFYEETGGLDLALGTMSDHGVRFLVFFRHVDDHDGWNDPDRYPAALASMARFIDRGRYGDPDRLASRSLRGADPSGGR